MNDRAALFTGTCRAGARIIRDAEAVQPGIVRQPRYQQLSEHYSLREYCSRDHRRLFGWSAAGGRRGRRCEDQQHDPATPREGIGFGFNIAVKMER